MYRIYDIGNNTWQVHTKDFGAREGSFQQVVQFMIFDLGFEFKEIETAISDMCDYGRNGAEFGVLRRYLFTFNKENKSAI